MSLSLVLLATLSLGAEPLRVGFAEADITPKLADGRDLWLAGYGHGRKAAGVHDPLYARAVVLQHGQQKIALACVDLVGLQLPEVRRIRDKLPDFDYVMVSSTHNHEGPDVIGIWGKSPLHRGVDDDYVSFVVRQTAQAIRQAEQNTFAATAHYGTASDDSLLGDSRRPRVLDAVLRVLRFERVDNGETSGILVQWNCHPESLGSRNKLITADFPYATVAALQEKHDCPVAYFTGAVGGLMAPPDHRFHDENGQELKEGQYEYAEAYGLAVAALAEKAIQDAEPIRLAPFVISAKPITVPLENKIYRSLRSIGVLRRVGRLWTGNFHDIDSKILLRDDGQPLAVETEVAYLRLGRLHVACIPGEIYPELVYGQFEDPADPGADYPEAPLETSVVEILPDSKWMLFGLANDEIGYIIPKRQWDEKPPYAYGRSKSQYGEINSCGAEVAPIIMAALKERVEEASSQQSNPSPQP